MNDRVYLPGLESVKSNSDFGFLTALIVILMFIAVGVALVFCFISVSGSGTYATDCAIAGGVCLVVCLICVKILRLPSFAYRWETASDGLICEGGLRRDLIRWHEITDVEVKWVNLRLGKRCVITSPGRVAYVLMAEPVFSASLWQHLHQIGKAEAITLDEEAASLWTSVPDDVPYELDWTNPNPPKLWVELTHLLIAIGILIVCSPRNNIVFCCLAVWFSPRFLVQKVKKISINSHNLAANTIFGRISLPWDKVLSAECTTDKLTLKVSRIISIEIPTEDNSDLVLAIIRCLRTREKPLLAPVPIRYIRTRTAFAEIKGLE